MKEIQSGSHFVTGGAGFIGSHLVDRLMANGADRITVYDNLSSGNNANIEHHLDKPNFQFIDADLLDLETLQTAMRGHQLVWHLGANTDIPKGNRITSLDLDNCTVATRNVLEAMQIVGARRIVFASSSTVYGDVPHVSIGETYGPLLPISLYGAGKLACEGLISSYVHLFELQAWIFRFGNVMGTRMGHGIIHDFLRKLRENSARLEILGDGNQEKNYFLVEDCIDGMLFALLHADEQCNLFNLGCETTIRVSRIAQIVVEEMGLADVEFCYTGGERGWPGDVPVIIYDVGNIRNLGWEASRTSEGTIRIATQRLIESNRDKSL